MNPFLLAAGILAVAVGIIHSILGEVLIFKQLRKGKIVPTATQSILIGRHIRIIWASWHIASFFGWGLAAILFVLATAPSVDQLLLNFIASAMLASGALVLFATQGKHPGWIGLLGVAVLCWMA
jgi:hypothetical protein